MKSISLDYTKAYEFEKGYIILTTKTSTLKDVVIPLGANPRKPSSNNKNVKEMITQLETDPTNFRRKNEGISIIANEAVIDQQSNKVIFEIDERQGIINGGHTYFVLNKYGVDNATVRIEINTGVPEKLTVEIAASRNASKKLATESELHHLGMFEWVKDSISPELRADVKFFEGDEGSIEIGELLQVANIINPTKGTIENAKRSYNGRGTILNSLKKQGMNAPIIRTSKHIEDLWELYTYIRTDEDLKDRFIETIYQDDQMYKGIAFYILAGVLQRRTDIVEGKVTIITDIDELRRIVQLKATDVNNKIIRLGQHFIGAVDSMVASDTFVEGIENVFLK
ncbi:AIPR family protein [Bacillus cereus group sp. N28]|uniref:AIPR family protein n=1 Tax=Bacillus cereus group sp. N28 TaxID=2794593 RepID=UPI0018F64EA7|nr:AIPR family protein [Bacillus cereus group sp. N28]MBJ7960553.1 AIPR family protein [Bacillus cereus group sp. N28]